MNTWILLLAAALLLCGSAGADIICGDMNLSGQIDISDLVYLVDFMFSGGPPLPFPPTGDCDGDGSLDISDLVCWVDCWFVLPGGCTPACPLGQARNHTDISGGCLRGENDGPSTRGMYIEAEGNSIHVYHPGAFYQCCLMYEVQYYQYENHFLGYETDTGDLCDCYCPFNLESVIQDLSPGEYVVTLFGIEGDFIGIDTAVVEAGVVEFNVGECTPPEVKGPPDQGDPIVNYSWSNGLLTMVHENAFFNCGADLVLEFEMTGDTLRFHEKNINDMIPVPCMCYYELTSVIEGLSPGTYVAEVYNQDYPWEPDLLLDRQQINLTSSGPVLIDFDDTGCLQRGGDDVRSTVSYTYSGDTLTLEHLDAMFNCAGIISVEFETAGDTLRFYEFNVSEDWVYCICPFNITATLAGVESGTYIVEVYARDYYLDPIELVDRRTLVLE